MIGISRDGNHANMGPGSKQLRIAAGIGPRFATATQAMDMAR